MATQVRQLFSPSRLSSVFSTTPGFLLLGMIFFLVAALFASAFPDAPGRSPASFFSTFAMAAPAFLATLLYLGTKRGILAIAALGAFGYAIELTGVSTGLPYGDFVYSDALGGKFLGLVPYLLPVSYVPLVIASVAATHRTNGNLILWVLRSTLLLVLIDGVLDPGAARLEFWIWADGGLYYGIPASNFFGWFVSGFVASLFFISLGSWAQPPRAGMLDGAILGLSFWVGVSVFFGFLIPVVLGVLLLVYLLRVRSRLVGGIDAG